MFRQLKSSEEDMKALQALSTQQELLKQALRVGVTGEGDPPGVLTAVGSDCNPGLKKQLM
jgi:hypothetical protein